MTKSYLKLFVGGYKKPCEWYSLVLAKVYHISSILFQNLLHHGHSPSNFMNFLKLQLPMF